MGQKNEEKGTYYAESKENEKKLLLAAFERQWAWKDARDGDSGVDATDLKYPMEFVDDGNVKVLYLEAPFNLKRAH